MVVHRMSFSCEGSGSLPFRQILSAYIEFEMLVK